MGRSFRFSERPQWRRWVTPRTLATKPIHRWYVFPHSFTDDLVHEFIRSWDLGPQDLILDPFVGAGTTLLAAQEMGISAVGLDLSPLSVLVSQVKVADYAADRLARLWEMLRRVIQRSSLRDVTGDQEAVFLRRALPGDLLPAFRAITQAIDGLDASSEERKFFLLALMSILPAYSRAVRQGGWLRWNEGGRCLATLQPDLEYCVGEMLKDVSAANPRPSGRWMSRMADARALSDASESYSAVITSPPYPNRHDYTRIFGVELMLWFLSWDETRALRHQSFHSHPEARPVRPEHMTYAQPARLQDTVAKIKRRGADQRVIAMLEGYFVDLGLALGEMRRVVKPRGKIALVVGNAQYQGVPVLVDQFAAQIGEAAGLRCEAIHVVRRRGNSAQQMGTYGRKCSRESVVEFSTPHSS